MGLFKQNNQQQQPLVPQAPPEAPAPPPLLGSPVGAKPVKKSKQAKGFGDTATANPKPSATYKPEAGAPQQVFGSNSLIGNA